MNYSRHSVQDFIQRVIVPFMEKPVLANFLLGMAEAFPKALIGTVIGYWLADEKIDVVTFGFFAGLTLPYALKLFWAPVADRVPLGVVTRKLGRRRGWLLVIIGLMAACILAIASTGPSNDILFEAWRYSVNVPGTIFWEPISIPIGHDGISGVYFTGVMVLGIAYLGATQDVIIDAYRLEIMEERHYGHGATALTFGYRAMGLFLGWAAVRFSDVIGWPAIFALCLLCFLPLLITLFWIGEPKVYSSEFLERAKSSAHSTLSKIRLPRWLQAAIEWLFSAVVLPFGEYMNRQKSWFLILVFVLLFKVGDAVVSALLTKFLTDTGFTKVQLADVKQAVGGLMLWLGVFCSALLYGWLGLYKSLFVTSILMAVTNLSFAWLASVGPDVTVLAIAMSAENFASGLSNVAIVAFLSGLCSKEYAATQYALLSSLAATAYALVGVFSGYLQQAFGWYEFYILSAVVSVPSILLLLWIWRRNGEEGLVSIADEATPTSQS